MDNDVRIKDKLPGLTTAQINLLLDLYIAPSVNVDTKLATSLFKMGLVYPKRTGEKTVWQVNKDKVTLTDVWDLTQIRDERNEEKVGLRIKRKRLGLDQ